MKVSDIKPYPKNARKHPKKQIDLLVESIKRFGFDSPIIIDKNNEVIAGHGRLEAAKQLGMEDVPVIQKESLTEKEVRAYRLMDNKIQELAEWDRDLALEELKAIEDKQLQELTGFDMDLLIDVKEDEFDAQAEYDKIKEPQTKLGNLYQLGSHRLLCGDSTKVESYEKLMGGGKASLIFTDPPYNVDYNYGWIYENGKKKKAGKIFNDKKTDSEFIEFLTFCFKNLFIFSTNDAVFYCWYAERQVELFRKGIVNAGWHISQVIIWLKNSIRLSFGYDYHRIWEPCLLGWKKGEIHFKNKTLSNLKDILLLDFNDFREILNVFYEHRDKDYIHPTQKPVRLAERAIKKHSNLGEIVLEPFNGSGSTMMACEQLGRKCYAIELDPKFVDVAIKRYEQSAGKKAIKIG